MLSRRVKRRPATLIELLISMALLTVLMTILYGVYGQVMTVRGELERSREESFRWRYVRSRLSWALQHAQPEVFHTSENGLVFNYDNGVDIRPYFAGLVLSRLFVDEYQRLVLLTWPNPEKAVIDLRMKKEVLLEGVSSWELVFYAPPDRESEDKPSGWVSSWAQDQKDLPAMVRISLELDETRKETFSFVLPYSKSSVKYYE